MGSEDCVRGLERQYRSAGGDSLAAKNDAPSADAGFSILIGAPACHPRFTRHFFSHSRPFPYPHFLWVVDSGFSRGVYRPILDWEQHSACFELLSRLGFPEPFGRLYWVGIPDSFLLASKAPASEPAALCAAALHPALQPLLRKKPNDRSAPAQHAISHCWHCQPVPDSGQVPAPWLNPCPLRVVESPCSESLTLRETKITREYSCTTFSFIFHLLGNL